MLKGRCCPLFVSGQRGNVKLLYSTKDPSF